MLNQNLPKLCLFLEEMVAQRKLIRNTDRKTPSISKESIPVKHFWKVIKTIQSPLLYLPSVVLSKSSVGTKTCLIESGSTLKTEFILPYSM